jgi:hypothetical protein
LQLEKGFGEGTKPFSFAAVDVAHLLQDSCLPCWGARLLLLFATPQIQHLYLLMF